MTAPRPSARRAAGSVIRDGDFWLYGGFGARGTVAPDDVGADIWRHGRAGWSLVTEDAGPGARYPSLIDLDGILWRFGGCGWTGEHITFEDRVWRFSGSKEWLESGDADPRRPRRSPKASVFSAGTANPLPARNSSITTFGFSATAPGSNAVVPCPALRRATVSDGASTAAACMSSAAMTDPPTWTISGGWISPRSRPTMPIGKPCRKRPMPGSARPWGRRRKVSSCLAAAPKPSPE